MGRPKKKGERIGNRLRRGKAVARDSAPDHIIARRELFSFLSTGNIDQDICDGIGQLHALGLLEGWGIDAKVMRDAGRDYTELWWARYGATATRAASYERAERTSNSYDGATSADRRFNRMDAAIIRGDKLWLLSLCEPGDTIVPWALSLIEEALRDKHRKCVRTAPFPTCEDRARLESACRGMVAVVEGESMRRAA